MNVGTRSNKVRNKNEEENTRSSSEGGKSVRFSRQMISDIFFVERVEKKYVKELFYTEKDIIGFQIDAMRKGERKARRNRERQVARSNSEGKVASRSRRDRDEESSKDRKSKKSSKKRNKDAASRRRFSNDDAPDYEPRKASEESAKKKSRDPLSEKRKSRKKSSSKRRGSDSSSSSSESGSKRKPVSPPRETMTQEQLLEKAMHWRRAANYKEDSDKLDANSSKPSDGTNVAIDPWTQDMLMTKAKKWGEALSSKVAATNPERKPTKPTDKTKQMAFLLARDAKESCSAEKLSEDAPPPPPPPMPDKLKESPTPRKKISSNTRDFAFMLAREAKLDPKPSNDSLEELPLSDDEVSVELSDLVMESTLHESMNMSQNDFLAEAMEKKKAEEEAANPLNKLRGIARSIMVTQAFQNLTMETEATKS